MATLITNSMWGGWITIHATERIEGDDVILGGITRHYNAKGELEKETRDEHQIRLVGGAHCWKPH